MNHNDLKRDLIRDEGYRLLPYEDSEGILTIGIGRNLEKGLSKDEVDVLYHNDIVSVEKDLDRSLPWWRMLDEPRQRVLANMCFNLGIGRLLGFRKTLKAIESGDYLLAAIEMLDSKWARQVGNRATRLARIMKES